MRGVDTLVRRLFYLPINRKALTARHAIGGIGVESLVHRSTERSSVEVAHYEDLESLLGRDPQGDVVGCCHERNTERPGVRRAGGSGDGDSEAQKRGVI